MLSEMLQESQIKSDLKAMFMPAYSIGNQIYAGQYVDGRRHGIGTLIDLSKGDEYLYEGLFQDGYPHGYGRVIKYNLSR